MTIILYTETGNSQPLNHGMTLRQAKIDGPLEKVENL